MADKITLLAALTFSTMAVAQPMSPSRALETIRAYFEAGKFEETIAKTKEILASTELTNEQRIAVDRFAGLSAFNLDDLPSAEDSFLKILFLNPDYVMDPFATPPAAIQFFETLRRNNETALQVVRQQISEREAKATKSGLVPPEAPPPSATTELPPSQPFDFLVFVPFGVHQFQQGRQAQGVTLAVTQGLLAIGSMVGFLALDSLYQNQTVTVQDRLGGDVSYTVRGIPFRRQNDAAFYRAVKEVSAIGFYVAYAAGVTEGLLLQRKPSTTSATSLHLNLNLMSGGAAAALTLSF